MKNQSYAFISVYNKENIVELAKALTNNNVQIISTGGTAKELEKNGLHIIPIEQITNSPESFDGRMKSISFQIAAGILFDRNNSSHQHQAETLKIPHIDYVVCNFYDFAKDPGIEMIDVGGPTMVRAAAKNYTNVTVLVDPSDYKNVIRKLEKNLDSDDDFRKSLAAKAFAYVAEYDNMIANYFQRKSCGR